jgi:hypothetical protein
MELTPFGGWPAPRGARFWTCRRLARANTRPDRREIDRRMKLLSAGRGATATAAAMAAELPFAPPDTRGPFFSNRGCWRFVDGVVQIHTWRQVWQFTVGGDGLFWHRHCIQHGRPQCKWSPARSEMSFSLFAFPSREFPHLPPDRENQSRIRDSAIASFWAHRQRPQVESAAPRQLIDRNSLPHSPAKS